MKHFPRKLLSLCLSAALCVSALALPAAASDALGDDLTAVDTLVNEATVLSTNTFWSTAYSDLRTENLITYEPNDAVTPIITYGSVLTNRSTVGSTAKSLEAQGYRVVAGINGDFYNTSTGLPIGIVISEGELICSDGGYYGIGFRADGTAVLGKPTVTVSADMGYQGVTAEGGTDQVVRAIAGVNKARVSTGGIYLYTYDFNAAHTTGNTEAGVDVVCSIVDGTLSIGGTLTLRVDQVLQATGPTAIGPDQIVLSVNSQSNDYFIRALSGETVGNTITITVSAAAGWEDVEYAVGALYSLAADGVLATGLPSGVNPRTAVGQKADGTLVFYTVDGRKSGYSVGASLTQVGQRLMELGCVNVLGLDGGGSTAIAATLPNATSAKTINTPSDGSERAVTNQIFLVASSQPTGELSHFYVVPDSYYVLAGSQVTLSVSAVDTNFIPMDSSYDLDTDDGRLDGNVLTTPSSGGEITVTASRGRKTGSATVYAVQTPDDVAIRSASGTLLTALSAAPGSTTSLTATAAYQHKSLKADAAAFTWSVTGDIGSIDQNGVFTAAAAGTGTITVTAGGRSASIPVTVSSTGPKSVEDFEGTTTIFRGSGTGMDFSLNHTADTVALGRGSAKVDYTLTEAQGYAAEWHAGSATAVDHQLYTSLHLWVYGDGSGNTLSLLYTDGASSALALPVATLDFTGWKQVSVSTAGAAAFSIQGLRVSSPLADDAGSPATALSGTVYIDQITASSSAAPDTAPPSVTLTAADGTLTAAITDAADGLLPLSSISVTRDGAAQEFTYSAATGALTTSLASDGKPHRITVTAKDASGNIGRASYDVPTGEGYTHVFTDAQADYWAADYVDFLYDTGITTGYADGTFRPNANITRAQFAAMLYRYLGLKEADYAGVTLPFADLSSIPDYALPAIRALYSQGIINGTAGTDGKLYFNPGASLTRAQAATMIGRTQAKGYASAELTFTDAGAIPAYAAPYIRTMAAQGIISGYTDGSFGPNANITRGQMAKILYNLL